MTCPRCTKGQVFRDQYGEMTCLQCGFRSAVVPPRGAVEESKRGPRIGEMKL